MSVTTQELVAAWLDYNRQAPVYAGVFGNARLGRFDSTFDF